MMLMMLMMLIAVSKGCLVGRFFHVARAPPGKGEKGKEEKEREGGREEKGEKGRGEKGRRRREERWLNIPQSSQLADRRILRRAWGRMRRSFTTSSFCLNDLIERRKLKPCLRTGRRALVCYQINVTDFGDIPIAIFDDRVATLLTSAPAASVSSLLLERRLRRARVETSHPKSRRRCKR